MVARGGSVRAPRAQLKAERGSALGVRPEGSALGVRPEGSALGVKRTKTAKLHPEGINPKGEDRPEPIRTETGEAG
jgi:uncharacterized protein YfaS (alpha-2-macroglobulin family)